MKHLISREDYINEYLRIKQEEKDNRLYEGLLSTVFGGLKMLFKKDWANINCKNPSVLTHLQAIDKSLAGYTMTKMQYYAECNNIRQNVADYFNDILEYKLLQLEKEENADKFIEKENSEVEQNTDKDGVAKYLNLKDKALLDSLKKYKENISTACKASPKLKEYADQMLNSVVVFVNDIIIKELEKKGADKAKLEEKRKKLEEEEKRLEEIRKKMNDEAKKADEGALKKIAEERDDALGKLGIKPIGTMGGDKAVETIAKQFKEMLDEFNSSELNESVVLPKSYKDIFKGETYIGIINSLEDINMTFNEKDTKSDEAISDKFKIRVILNKINTAFEVVSNSKNKPMFDGVASASVQAMMASLSNAIIYGFMGDKFDIEKEERLSLLTKCVIDSDATIGFNLPLIDPKKPDNGNFFAMILNQFRSDKISHKEVEDAVEKMSKEDIESILNSKSLLDSGDSDSDFDADEALKENREKFAKTLGAEIMKDFRDNMSKLFDIVLKKAKDIKKKAEDERAAAAAAAAAGAAGGMY